VEIPADYTSDTVRSKSTIDPSMPATEPIIEFAQGVSAVQLIAALTALRT